MTVYKQWRTADGVKTVLAVEGRKYIHVLVMDSQLIVRKVPKTELRYMRDPIECKSRKSLTPVINTFARFGRTHGATKAAKRFLREARKTT